ncbi:hypothetical protein BH24CHL4_BH24CHL4_20130 [soil metagenome]
MSSIEEFIREERSEWDEEHQEIDCATSQTCSLQRAERVDPSGSIRLR